MHVSRQFSGKSLHEPYLLSSHQYVDTGGKPSTWFPPGGLVEQRHLQTKRQTNKNQRTKAGRDAKAKPKQSKQGDTTKTNNANRNQKESTHTNNAKPQTSEKHAPPHAIEAFTRHSGKTSKIARHTLSLIICNTLWYNNSEVSFKNLKKELIQ